MPRKELIESKFSRYFSVCNFLSVFTKLGKNHLFWLICYITGVNFSYEEPSGMNHSNHHSFPNSWGLFLNNSSFCCCGGCLFIYLFYFTILYWFCLTSTCICHGWTRVPILNLPPPSTYHRSRSSQCTSPKLPVSCIQPGLAIHFLYDIIHVLMPFSQIIPPSLSHRVQKTVLYICVSFAVSHTGLLLPSF